MYKIRILTDDFHTFYPYKKEYDEFLKRGIKLFFGDTPDYDLTLIGHSLFQDKKLGSFEASLEKGLNFLKNIKGPYILVDGQDSHSLIGSYETFINSNALVLLKHSLLKNKELYKESWVGGRFYWGKSEDYGVANQNYKPIDFDKYSDKILLSGTNWIGVPDIQWYDYEGADKLFDVSGMFQFPHPECHEFDLKPSQDFYYNGHRKPVLDILNNSPFMVSKLYKGRRVSPETYYKYIACCKVLLAPFGYGEMAPRDLESAQLGSLLIKPNMDHIDTYPNIYIKDKTYISCKHDYSDLSEKIEYAVENFDKIQKQYVETLKQEYLTKYRPGYLADYTVKLFKELNIL
jgi:hypothetical protein